MNIVAHRLKKTPLEIIKKSIRGKKLKREDFINFFRGILDNKVSDVELTAFIMRQYYQPFSIEEIADMTVAMVEVGKSADFGRNTVDKHSIGGVPGNKVSLIIVPIIASTDLKIPKTSSRSITTIGTADTMEVLAPVNLKLEEAIEVVNKANGCIVWGGGLDIVPVDGVFIERVEHVLEINPVSQMMASILGKKLAMGVRYLVLDIPQGRGTKVETIEKAMALSKKFNDLGSRLGIRIESAITYGDQPVGHAVGPALEAWEALLTLEGKIMSTSLLEKATGLAGMLLEMTGKAVIGNGSSVAKDILSKGKALKKMKKIIELQGGDPKVSSKDIQFGEYHEIITSPIDGFIVQIDNKAIMEVVKAAGAPEDKKAGVLIHKKGGRYVKRGEPLMTIYSSNEGRLDRAVTLARTLHPIVIEGMIRKRIRIATVL